MKLFELQRVDVRKFMQTRQNIQRIFFIALIIAYGALYFLVSPKNTPVASYVFTLLATPFLVFCYYHRACSFFFVRNTYYIPYLIISGGVFLYAMSFICPPVYEREVSYEFVHVVATAVFGFGAAMVVAVPFKLIHTILFDAPFFYESNDLTKLEYEAFPEKKKADVEKKQKESGLKYDTMNETQLQVELNIAIKEDRFEEANKIKKVLDKKFNIK